MSSFNQLYKNGILSGVFSDFYYTAFLRSIPRRLLKYFSQFDLQMIRNEETSFITRKQMLISGIVKYYDEFGTKASSRLNNDYPITQCEIEQYFSDSFSTYDTFIVFGCPKSTDIDVACFVNMKYDDFGHPMPLFSTEQLRLKSELEQLGYDIQTREIDVVLLIVSEKRIISMSKGGNMIGNVILKTHDLHNQTHCIPQFDFIRCDQMDSLKALSKFILDNLEILVTDYQAVRNEKLQSYVSGSNAIIDYSLIVNKYYVSEPTNCQNWRDRMKSLIMKYLQFILLERNEYVYTKQELVESSERMFVGTREFAEWFLFRGKSGSFSSEYTQMLHTEFVKIANNVMAQFNMKTTPIQTTIISTNLLTNKTILPDEVFNEFIVSPYDPTSKFNELWDQSFGNSAINAMFPINCSSQLDQQYFSSLVPSEIQQKIIWISQRSPEWLKQLDFYICGNHSKIIDDTPLARFNLIRGAITELIIMDVFDPTIISSQFKKYSVGFVVEKIGQKSPGCAPDLLLQHSVTGEIIPVEIKCLRSGAKNCNYYRALDLATDQCKRVKSIISEITRGLIIFGWFAGDNLELHFFMIDL